MTQVCKLFVVLTLFVGATFHSVAQFDAEHELMGKEKVKQRIEDYRKVRLIDVLDLEGAKLEKFFGVYNKTQDRVRAMKQALDEAAKECRDAIVENGSEAEVQLKSEKLQAAMRSLEEAIHTRHNDIKAVLSIKEFATYLAFEATFMEELQRMVLRRGMKNRNR